MCLLCILVYDTHPDIHIHTSVYENFFGPIKKTIPQFAYFRKYVRPITFHQPLEYITPCYCAIFIHYRADPALPRIPIPLYLEVQLLEPNAVWKHYLQKPSLRDNLRSYPIFYQLYNPNSTNELYAHEAVFWILLWTLGEWH